MFYYYMLCRDKRLNALTRKQKTLILRQALAQFHSENPVFALKRLGWMSLLILTPAALLAVFTGVNNAIAFALPSILFFNFFSAQKDTQAIKPYLENVIVDGEYQATTAPEYKSSQT